MDAYLSAKGIGDAVCGLYAACGAAEAGHQVMFHTRQGHWLSRFAHPGVMIVEDDDIGIDMNANYNLQLHEREDRKLHYCQALAAGAGVAEFEPALPRWCDRSHRTEGEIFGREKVVLLSPFSAWRAREWPTTHFARLAHLLDRAGFGVAALVSSADDPRARAAFGYMGGWMTWMYGQSPAYISEMLLAAHCVVANDSGMAHLAGLLGTPTVAVHAQLPSKLLFSHTEIVSVMPQTRCAGCRWQGARGWAESCDALGCSALASVSPERVLQAVQAVKSEVNYAK